MGSWTAGHLIKHLPWLTSSGQRSPPRYTELTNSNTFILNLCVTLWAGGQNCHYVQWNLIHKQQPSFHSAVTFLRATIDLKGAVRPQVRPENNTFYFRFMTLLPWRMKQKQKNTKLCTHTVPGWPIETQLCVKLLRAKGSCKCSLLIVGVPLNIMLNKTNEASESWCKVQMWSWCLLRSCGIYLFFYNISTKCFQLQKLKMW